MPLKKVNKMNINKNFAVFAGFLLGVFTLSNFTSGAKDRKQKTDRKRRKEFYAVNSTSADFSSCFGPVDNPNGVLCSACYRALSKYKISKKTSARVSK